MKQRVLIIEDEENNLHLITRLAEKAGLTVSSARTGEAGIAAALAEKPDLILLDIGLPDMDGTEVLKVLRNSETNGDLPIIAMTSYAMSGDRERLLALGCSGYIEKPYEPALVMKQVLDIVKATGG